MKKVKEITGCSPNSIPQELLLANEPIIFKGLVTNWPLVKAGQLSPTKAVDYLTSFYQGKEIGSFTGSAEIKGRYFYNQDLSGLNFNREYAKIDQVLQKILFHLDDPHPPCFYLGSAHIESLLPGLKAENDLASLADFNALASIWLSNKSRIAAHQDGQGNIACCAAGTRKFTLFPPEQLENLYIGPLDFTLAGQAVSLVDFHQPDFKQFPKFRQALATASIAELSPGDALYIPCMWWHHVESLSDFNILVNFWWNKSPEKMGAPVDALLHALLNIKNLPLEQKKVWQNIFNYYVFNNDEQALSHIPKESMGVLDSSDGLAARKIRAQLLNNLNR